MTASTVVALLALVLGAVAAGCTQDSSSPSTGASETPRQLQQGRTLDAKPAPLEITVRHVAGRLPKAARKRFVRKATRVVRPYFRSAFLDGRYPRRHFPGAFQTFTKGARTRARHDVRLLTNKNIGRSTTRVTPRRRRVALDVLAPGGSPVGATARVRLVFRADRGEKPARRVVVTGRLLLTRTGDHHWRVFGYDVAKSSSPTKGGRG